MSSTASNVIFDDIFTVHAIDKEGKKFDRVSRLYARSKNYDMELTLDYNVELLPLSDGATLALALATSLARGPPAAGGGGGGGEDEDAQDAQAWRPDGRGRRGLEDEYDYVMYGKVYKIDSDRTEAAVVYASFGGLLMSLTGSYRHMSNFVLGDPVYILLRR